jgi:hypothetical protein
MLAGSDEFQKRFEREARAASKLSHPGCVAVLDFGRVERVEPPEDEARLAGTRYLVMEFVRGHLLVEKLEQGRVSPRFAVEVTRGLLSALGHAHELGLVHRDLKPANVMILPTGGVKLLDFGLAKDLTGDEAALTQAGMVFGTPGYISPEQASGQPAGKRSDLYAVGVMLFEMATGRRLFPREDPLDVVGDHLTRAPDRPRQLNSRLSADLEAVILRALVKDPNERFASAAEFDAALAACPEARGDGARSLVDGFARLHARMRGVRPWTIVAGSAAATFLVVLAAFFGLRSSRPEAPPPAPAFIAPSNPVISDGARRHVQLAVSYQRKLWCSDAIEELERAMREDEHVSSEPDVARTAVACLGAKTQARAIRFLVEKLGAGSRPTLEAAIASDPNPDVRHGAEKALDRLK